MTIPKFLITLDRQAARNQEFARNNPGLTDLRVFNSYDAQEPDYLDDWARSKVAPNLNWPPGAIACGLAHMKLWETCVELGKPIIILENDAKLIHNFDTHIEEVAKRLPEDWDVILFGSNWDSFVFIDLFSQDFGTIKLEFNQQSLESDFEKEVFEFHDPHFYKLRVTYGTHCYLISPKGAQEFLRRIPILDDTLFGIPRTDLILNPNTLDGLMNQHYQDLSCFISFPPMSFVKNDKSVSTIWVEGVNK